ncbi:MAG: ECF-type sigma factor [Planctomycetota bacterium]
MRPDRGISGSEPTEVGLETLYRRLKAICGRRIAAESIDHTLQATALANEVWLKLYELSPEKATNPSQATRWFVANAVIAVRQVLVDHARRRRSLKRGGSRTRIGLDGEAEGFADGVEQPDSAILAINDLLGELANVAPMQAEIVALRFFGGLSFRQIAAHLGRSDATVRREWALARVWLGSRPGLAGWGPP